MLSIKGKRLFIAALFAACHNVWAQQLGTAAILLYTATADFRHDSIPTAIEALRNQSKTGNFNVRFDATEDKAQFTDDKLATYDAIMFVSTTGEGAYSSLITKHVADFISVHA